MRSGQLSVGAMAALVCAACWAAAPTQDDLLRDAVNTQDVVTVGMGLNVNRFSPLDQINTRTVKDLAPVWTASLDDDRGQEAQPLVHDGVIYAITHKSTFAFDARTGRQLWRHDLNYEKRMFRVVCCGLVARGAVLYEGKLIRQTLDNHVLALDMKTGKEVWNVQAADWQDGYTMTGAPLVADGVVIAGVAGGDMGVRGFLDGYDANTGKKLWRFWTTAGPDDPNGKTWQGDTYLHGGGATWLPGSYDPKLDLVYWGIGNPGPWNATVRPGDNLYTDSVVALRPKTGERVWHYQYTPNDTYDYDGVNELIQADLSIDGKARQVIMTANRNGFFYVIDRATGELLRANPFIDTLNWATGLEPKTGKPILSDVARATLAGEEQVIWPSNIGGKNWGPASYNPNTGLVYLNGFELSMKYKLLNASWRRGMMFVAADFSFRLPDDGKPLGYLRAINPLTGKRVWQVPVDPPANGGTLTTAGDLVFTGLMTGELVAHHARSGKRLWSYKTASGIIGPPITYDLDGEQYVASMSGIGGLLALYLPHPALAKVPKGGSLTVFRLPRPQGAAE